MDCSLPGFSVHWILQARILENPLDSSGKNRVSMPSSRGIFLTQGSNLHLLRLLYWQVGSLPLAPPEKPILDLLVVYGLPQWLSSNESTCNAGDADLIPGSRRYPGKGNGYPLQYSCLENSMGSGAWQATVHRATKVQIRLRNWAQQKNEQTFRIHSILKLTRS